MSLFSYEGTESEIIVTLLLLRMQISDMADILYEAFDPPKLIITHRFKITALGCVVENRIYCGQGNKSPENHESSSKLPHVLQPLKQ